MKIRSSYNFIFMIFIVATTCVFCSGCVTKKAQHSPSVVEKIYTLKVTDHRGKAIDFDAQMVFRRISEQIFDLQIRSDTVYFLKPMEWDRWYINPDSIEIQPISGADIENLYFGPRSTIVNLADSTSERLINSSQFRMCSVRSQFLEGEISVLLNPKLVGSHEWAITELWISNKNLHPTGFRLITPHGQLSFHIEY